MRFLVPAAFAAAAAVALLCLALQPPGQAHAAASSQAVAGAATDATRMTAATSPAGAAQRRLVGPGQAQPQLFFGKWWKKFKRILERVLDFIDGILDDLKPHNGDEPLPPPDPSAGLSCPTPEGRGLAPARLSPVFLA